MLVFDLHTIGNKLLSVRKRMGMTQAEVAESAGLSDRTYADIERGSCGMSIESLISIGKILDMSLDYIIYGKLSGETDALRQSDEIHAILSILSNASEQKQKYIMRLLQLQLAIWDPEETATDH